MQRKQLGFLFLNVGHFLDHYFMLIFATVAALHISTEWGLSYAELIPYATPGFIAFGVCAIPAGWLADKWSRTGMMLIFFFGIGASSILTSMASNPVQMATGLALIGLFAAIYHPVGLAMVVQGRKKTGMPLAINGVFGNMGVACTALLTGFLIDTSGWRSAFIIPGIASMGIGAAYLWFVRSQDRLIDQTGDPDERDTAQSASGSSNKERSDFSSNQLLRVFGIIIFTTAIGGLIFQSTTFALPKVFDERLSDIANTATLVGWYTFIVFSVAAFAQLVVGYLVDHHSIRMVFACVAVLQALFFALMMQLSGILALLVAVAFMLAVFGQIPINDVLIGRMVRSEWRSRAYGIRYVITFSVMATAVPFIAHVHSNWGFSVLFGMLAAAAMCIFIAVLFLPNFKKS